MTTWSRYLFGASLVLAIGVAVLDEKLPEGWGPVLLLVLVLFASVFLTRSVIDHRREHAMGDTSAP